MLLARVPSQHMLPHLPLLHREHGLHLRTLAICILVGTDIYYYFADAMGVAKGLFYYCFDSKEELLNLMTERLLEELRETTTKIVAKKDASAMEKVELLMAASAEVKIKSAAIVSFFHQPRNRLLHFGIEQRSYEFLVPAFESIVEQGMRKGMFHTKHPHETVVAYLGAASAVGHEGVEKITNEQLLRRAKAFQSITENMLGCGPERRAEEDDGSRIIDAHPLPYARWDHGCDDPRGNREQAVLRGTG